MDNNKETATPTPAPVPRKVVEGPKEFTVKNISPQKVSIPVTENGQVNTICIQPGCTHNLPDTPETRTSVLRYITNNTLTTV